MAFNLSMNASDIDKTLVESRQLLDSDPATKQYVNEAVANAGGSGGVVYVNFTTTDGNNYTSDKTFAELESILLANFNVVGVISAGNIWCAPLSMYMPGMGAVFSALTMDVETMTPITMYVIFGADNTPMVISHTITATTS